MTSPRRAHLQTGSFPSFLPPDAQCWFTKNGWTPRDWSSFYGTDAHDSGRPGRQHLREWLRDPPTTSPHGVTPGTLLDVFAAYGPQTPEVLNAYTEGASPRFVAALLALRPAGNPALAWKTLARFGLTEPEATGWAHTALLYDGQPEARLNPMGTWVTGATDWIKQFGPGSYLWALAGYTLDEVAALQDAGTTVSEQQLRVMVALTGAILPAGI